MRTKLPSHGQRELPKICVIDDNPVVGLRMRKVLNAGGFDDVTVFRGALPALDAFRRDLPELVLVDYGMPHLDGIRFIEVMRNHAATRSLPILMFTGHALENLRERAIVAGASGVVSKNVTGRELLVHVKSLLGGQPREVREIPLPGIGWGALARHADDAHISADDHALLHRLERVAQLRDNSTSQHTSRMAHYAAAIGLQYGLTAAQAQMLRAAAPLHDLGKIGTPDAVLHKPGPLMPDEWIIMKRHAMQGYELLCDSPSPAMRLGAEIALAHHERWDGTGYPQGIKGEQIPLSGRLVAVADVLDALTSERPYKQAWTFDRALEEISAGVGSHFDPAVVQALHGAREQLRCIRQRFSAE